MFVSSFTRTSPATLGCSDHLLRAGYHCSHPFILYWEHDVLSPALQTGGDELRWASTCSPISLNNSQFQKVLTRTLEHKSYIHSGRYTNQTIHHSITLGDIEDEESGSVALDAAWVKNRTWPPHPQLLPHNKTRADESGQAQLSLLFLGQWRWLASSTSPLRYNKTIVRSFSRLQEAITGSLSL